MMMMMMMRISLFSANLGCTRPLRSARRRHIQPQTPVCEVSQGLSQLIIDCEIACAYITD
jgi:hypothetical protein